MSENKQAIYSRLNRTIAELKGWQDIHEEHDWEDGPEGYCSFYVWVGTPPDSEFNLRMPCWSTDMNEALKLLEEIDGKLAWDVTRWEIVARPEGYEDWPVIYARNAAVGICQAWLRMHGKDINKLIMEGEVT